MFGMFKKVRNKFKKKLSKFSYINKLSSKIDGLKDVFGASEVRNKSEKNTIKICLTNFWTGFEFKGSFIENLINFSCEDNFEIIKNGENADVVISSVFGNVRYAKEKTIYLIWENRRPDFRVCKYALSMDIDDYYGKNCYLPVWYGKIRWPGFKYKFLSDNNNPHNQEDLISLNSLTSKRNLEALKDKTKFCGIIAANPEILRMNLTLFISNFYKKIDGFGPAFNKFEKRSKRDILREYKFCLCPENSIYPGYMTEKLIEAWDAGAVPLWSGLNIAGSNINQNAFLNYQNFDQMNEFIKKIILLDQNFEEYIDIYEQPLFLKKPEIKPIVEFLKKSISDIKQSS